MGPGEDLDDNVEELESPERAWSPTRVAATALVAVVALTVVVLAALAGHPAARPHPHADEPQPQPVPTPPRQVARVQTYHGSVFLEPLEQCLQTDHERTLRLAVQVTNLTNSRLRLVTATPVSTLPGYRLGAVRFWARPCGGTITDRALDLPPSGHVVVALNLILGNGCPSQHTVDARLTFHGSSGYLEAESSPLANLTRVPFAQCGHS